MIILVGILAVISVLMITGIISAAVVYWLSTPVLVILAMQVINMTADGGNTVLVRKKLKTALFVCTVVLGVNLLFGGIDILLSGSSAIIPMIINVVLVIVLYVTLRKTSTN